MNLPNKLTILRGVLVPIFVFFMLFEKLGTLGNYIAALIFLAAAITDYFDGHIARKYNLITNFGKFMDPLADKLLVISAGICLVALDRVPAWVVIILIAREFAISGFRLVAAGEGLVIAASMWGKSKTVVQMFMMGFFIVNHSFTWWQIMEIIFMYASVVLTIISLVDYIWKNKHVLKKIS